MKKCSVFKLAAKINCDSEDRNNHEQRTLDSLTLVEELSVLHVFATVNITKRWIKMILKGMK